MSIFLPEEILLYYVLTSNIYEHRQSLRHLTITNISGKKDVNIRKLVKSNLRIFLNMIVPHFHELLLSRVDIREVVNHLAGLDPEPLRVWVVLVVLSVEDGVGGDGEAGGAEVVQPVVATDEGPLVLVRA